MTRWILILALALVQGCSPGELADRILVGPIKLRERLVDYRDLWIGWSVVGSEAPAALQTHPESREIFG